MAQQWWRGSVLYQIYPRSFYDGRGNGIGDLLGIKQKLGYVADLGVDGIWVSPFFKSPMKDFGYDVSDYCDVDPIFGSVDDFKALVERAHELNLKVIIDQVWSHTSDRHAWFQESRQDKDNPKHDWYVWADPKPDGSPPNNWISYFGGSAWGWSAKRRQYYLCHFLKSQPAVNVWNMDVRKALLDVGRFWLDLGVDGFRMDAIQQYIADDKLRDNPARLEGDPLPADLPAENPMAMQRREYSSNRPETLDWMAEIRSMVNEYDDRALMAEVGGEDSQLMAAKYVQGDKLFHFAYTFDLLTSEANKEYLVNIFKEAESIIGDGWLCWSFSNHDVERVASRWYQGAGNKNDLAYMVTALGVSMRGSYCMYQGEELGLPEADVPYELMQDPYGLEFYPEFKGRDGCRTPMPWNDDKNAGFSTSDKVWLPVAGEHLSRTVESQKENKSSFFHRVRSLLHWQKDRAALREGAVDIIDTPNDVIILRRRFENEIVLCVFNLSADAVPLHDASLIEGLALDGAVSSGVSISDSGDVALAGFSAGFFVSGS
jgi:alpha-glucosidase